MNEFIIICIAIAFYNFGDYLWYKLFNEQEHYSRAELSKGHLVKFVILLVVIVILYIIKNI